MKIREFIKEKRLAAEAEIILQLLLETGLQAPYGNDKNDIYIKLNVTVR